MSRNSRQGSALQTISLESGSDLPLMDAPLHINWNISYACPLNCAHCYSRGQSTLSELSLADKLTVAKNIIDSRVFSVNLGGGEPRVSPDTLPVIYELSSHGVRVSLSSNGLGITAKEVSELKSAGLDSCILSLDFATAESHDALRRQTGCFDGSLDAARLFTAQGVKVVFSTVLNTENLDDLEAIATLATDVGAGSIELKRLRLSGNAKNLKHMALSASQEAALLKIIANIRSNLAIPITLVYGAEALAGVDNGCPCGRTALAILSNGAIAPCVYNPMVIGNALTDSIDRLWCDSPYLAHLREHFTCHGMEDSGDKIQIS